MSDSLTHLHMRFLEGPSTLKSCKIFAQINGELSGGSCVHRPGSEDPIGVSRNLNIYVEDQTKYHGSLKSRESPLEHDFKNEKVDQRVK